MKLTPLLVAITATSKMFRMKSSKARHTTILHSSLGHYEVSKHKNRPINSTIMIYIKHTQLVSMKMHFIYIQYINKRQTYI